MCDSWDTGSESGTAGSGSGGSGGMAGTRKWVCKACTYENWPRALKCAICCHPKNYNIFLDPHRPHDIYEIASLFESAQNQNNVYNPKNKWSCPSCTYLNWPKANKCTQCQRRRSSSPPFGLDRDHIRSPKLKSKDHHHHHSESRRSENHTYPLIPSWPAPASPDLRSRSGDMDGSDYYYNDRNRITDRNLNERRTSFSSTRSPPPTASATTMTTTTAAVTAPNANVQKWSCSVCTYENWPRATRCNMCQAWRRRSSSSRSSETDAITDNLSLMRLAADASSGVDADGCGIRAEASGGILIDSLSGFPSDSEAEEDENRISTSSGRSDGHAAFKQTRKRE